MSIESYMPGGKMNMAELLTSDGEQPKIRDEKFRVIGVIGQTDSENPFRVIGKISNGVIFSGENSSEGRPNSHLPKSDSSA